MEIDVTSSAGARLALRQGRDRTGTILEESGSVGSRNLNPSMNLALAAGGYTLEIITQSRGADRDLPDIRGATAVDRGAGGQRDQRNGEQYPPDPGPRPAARERGAGPRPQENLRRNRMYISDGARALLTAPIEKEWSQTTEEGDTAFSDHKGDSCVTRIFRGHTAQQAQAFADVWIARLHEQCFSPGNDITVRQVAIPRLGEENDEANLVVAVNAYDLDLKEDLQEEQPPGRTRTTKQGVILQENPGDPTRIGIRYESNLIESLGGNISYDGQLWRDQRGDPREGSTGADPERDDRPDLQVAPGSPEGNGRGDPGPGTEDQRTPGETGADPSGCPGRARLGLRQTVGRR